MPDAVTDGRRWLTYMAVDDLPENPLNPKDHADSEIDDSLERFGYTEPVMLDERTGWLVAGHGRKARVIARRDAGKPPPRGVLVGEDGVWRVPVNRGWSSVNDLEARAYLVTSNRLTEKGGWKQDPLVSILSELAAAPAGLIGVGFTRPDLDGMLRAATDAQLDEQDPPEMPEVLGHVLVTVDLADLDAVTKRIEAMLPKARIVRSPVGP